MSRVGVLGAGAFGTALAISLARDGKSVTLCARSPEMTAELRTRRMNAARLDGFAFPEALQLADAPVAEVVLLAVPAQSLPDVLDTHADALSGRMLVACCKGINLQTGVGPAQTIAAHIPAAQPGLLSGPSFAVDIAAGLPTALTIAAASDAVAKSMQDHLSSSNLRLYRSTDIAGVEIGGALKNVIAIACGITIGAGLGESARAALMTRGYAEMSRFALARGARAETLAGLSGLGDLALTCGSAKSRNFAYGLQLGTEGRAGTTATTEGIATARAVADLAAREGLDMPITAMIARVLANQISVPEAARALLARPLRPE